MYRLLRLRSGSFYDPGAVEAARAAAAHALPADRLPARRRSTARAHTQAGEVDVDFTIDEGTPVNDRARSSSAAIPACRPTISSTRCATLVGKPHRREAARDGERILLEQLRAGGLLRCPDRQRMGRRAATTPACCGSPSTPARATEIEIVGNESRSREQLLGLMDLETRLIVTDGTWRELARRMKRDYQEAATTASTCALAIDDGDAAPHRLSRSTKGGRTRCAAVAFAGNEQLTSSELRDEMNTQPARWLPWPRYGRLRARRVRRGPAPAVVLLSRAGLRRCRDRRCAGRGRRRRPAPSTITVVIDEGPRTIVEAVRPPDLSGLPDRRSRR